MYGLINIYEFMQVTASGPLSRFTQLGYFYAQPRKENSNVSEYCFKQFCFFLGCAVFMSDIREHVISLRSHLHK